MSQATNLTRGFQPVMVLILKNICTFDMEIKPTNECKHLKASYYKLSYMYVFGPQDHPHRGGYKGYITKWKVKL